MTRRLLVLGQQGQVARALAACDPSLTCFGRDRLDLGKADAIAPALGAFKPDLIINAAAYTAVDKAESETAQAFALNRDAVAALGLAAKSMGVPVIHVSTDYVFDGTKIGAYGEDDPIAPLGVYGQSKAEGEAALRDAGADHVILRTSWVFAPHGANFVKTMLRLGAEREVLRVVGDQRGKPSFAPDLAQAILAIADRVLSGQGTLGTFHIANAQATTWYDFARAIVANLPKPPRVEAITTAEYPTPAKRPANSELSTDKLAAAYDLRLRPWTAALDDCLRALGGNASTS